MEDTKPVLSELSTSYHCNNLVEDKTCFKNPENPRCIDLFTTNSIMIFQNTTAVATKLSDFYIMIVAVCKTYFPKYNCLQELYKIWYICISG